MSVFRAIISTLLTISFAACVVSFIVPYWAKKDSLSWPLSTGEKLTIGLFSLRGTFSFNGGSGGSKLWIIGRFNLVNDKADNFTDWQRACIGLFGCALVVQLIGLIMSKSQMCRANSKRCNRVVSVTVALLLLLSAGAMAVSIIVFGVYTDKGELLAHIIDNDNLPADSKLTDKQLVADFEWGFYLAIAGAGLNLFCSLLYFIDACLFLCRGSDHNMARHNGNMRRHK